MTKKRRDHPGSGTHRAGWHPGAWRAAHARPAELLTAQYWADLVRKGRVRTAGFRDVRGPIHRIRSRRSRRQHRPGAGQLDSVLVASRVAPLTRHIGLIPTAVVTHRTVSPVQGDRDTRLRERRTGGYGCGYRAIPGGAALFGRRRVDDQHAGELLDEAADYATALGLLWDSWEDDAEIRDNTTGRFIDRDKLRTRISPASSSRFADRPSSTPWGRPPIAALAHSGRAHRFVGASADLGFITPDDENTAAAIVADITGDRHDDAPVRLVVDLAVTIGDTDADAHRRADELNSLSAQPIPAMLDCGGVCFPWPTASHSGPRSTASTGSGSGGQLSPMI